MRTIHIDPTFKCNMNCLFCEVGGRKRAIESRVIPLNELIRFLNRSNIESDCRVSIAGGEPTVYKDLFPLIEYITSKGAIARIFTNCIRFSDFNFAMKAAENGLKEISTNLYAHNSETYDYLTKTKGNFEKVISGIRNLFVLRDDYGYPLQIELKILVTKSIMPYIHKIVELTASEFPHPSSLGIYGINVRGSAKKNMEKVVCRLSEASPHIRKAIDVANTLNRKIEVLDIPPCILKDKRYFRFFKYNSCFIDSQILPHSEIMSRHRLGVVKGSQCVDCIMNRGCSGIREFYAKEYGFDELKPILS